MTWNRKHHCHCLIILCALICATMTFAFQLRPFLLPFHQKFQRQLQKEILQTTSRTSGLGDMLTNNDSRLYQSTTSSEATTATKSESVTTDRDKSNDNSDLNKWKVADLRAELGRLGVSYKDCFDKESLVLKLQHARQNIATTNSNNSCANSNSDLNDVERSFTNSDNTNTATKDNSSDIDNGKSDNINQFSLSLDEIRTMHVKELRQELAQNNMRWAGLLEKEDLVQVVYQGRQQRVNFSATGLLVPGQVTDLTGPQALEEAHYKSNNSKNNKTPAPLLLDVYAVWCGPCKMMAEQLQMAAQEWQTDMRVAKFDSDKYPQQAGRLRVNGLPTLILYQNGKERARLEGAVPKAKLMQWVQQHLE